MPGLADAWLSRVAVKVISSNIELRVVIGRDGAKLWVLFRFDEVSDEGPMFKEGAYPAMSAHVPMNEQRDDGAQQAGPDHGICFDIGQHFGSRFLQLLVSVMCHHLHIINL